MQKGAIFAPQRVLADQLAQGHTESQSKWKTRCQNTFSSQWSEFDISCWKKEKKKNGTLEEG